MEDMSVDNDSAFFEEEASLTHPRCYDNDHVEKLETFAEDLDQALKTSFPSGPNPYTAVHVLLLQWTEDDLGVQFEISALRRVFETRFHFDVEEWQIPSLNSIRALQKKLYGFQDIHQSETELLIVYYGGHAKADPRRGRSIWQAHRQPNSPFLNWSSLQPLLETAVPHVLIILDCCFAATAARDTTEGTTKEILAACGRESPTHGVGQRSFTSALIEEMLAFDGAPFTAAMLHSRLVTMRWRLAYTPIYALLSERGGNSVTICPFSDGKGAARLEPDFLAELEATETSQDGEASMMIGDSPSPPIPLKQTIDTRVLLSVSVVQDAIHDVSHWVSWLTTATPWDVTKVDVKVHSIFKSHSTLVVVSVPTSAWNRLPERPAYRFIGFIRSEDIYQAAKISIASITKPVSSHGTLPPASQEVTSFAPYRHEWLPSSLVSSTAIQSTLTPSLGTTPFAVDEMKTPTPNTAQRLSSVREAGAFFYPTTSQSDFQSDSQAQLIDQRHKRQRTDSVAQPAAKVPRRSPRFSFSEATTSPPKGALDQEETPESHIDSDQHPPGWPPENDELLMRARQEGLNWQPIASQYFPDKTANACRKRHERLMEKRNDAENWNGVKIEILAKAYVDVREQMWKLLADRMREKWQNVEAKCMEKGLKVLQTAGRTASRRETRPYLSPDLDSDEISDSRFPPSRRERSRSYQDEDDFNDSAIGVEENIFVNDDGFRSSRDDHQQAPHSAGGRFNPSSSQLSPRFFGVNSNTLPSLTGFTPTVTAAPQFPSVHQQPQTLPSFNTGFGVPTKYTHHPKR